MALSRAALWGLPALLLLAGCGGEKTPDRNQIPYLKAALYDLQRAVSSQSATAVDSMLSGELGKLGADSLLSFVYGSDRSFAFERFGGSVIAYTDANARIDCFVMDSLLSEDRPISFSLIFDGDRWLFTKVESGQGIEIRDHDGESEDSK